ncbi:MAG: hypothetical protein QM757_20785, partial [Paludibaculum sp.]
MFFLGGVARYLFVPLGRGGRLRDARLLHPVADAGPHAGHVPAEGQKQHGTASRNPLVLFQRGFERAFERLRGFYSAMLARLVAA